MIGSLDEFEGADRLIHVLARWGEVPEDEGEGISCERLLEESGQFGLPKGSCGLLIATG